MAWRTWFARAPVAAAATRRSARPSREHRVWSKYCDRRKTNAAIWRTVPPRDAPCCSPPDMARGTLDALLRLRRRAVDEVARALGTARREEAHARQAKARLGDAVAPACTVDADAGHRGPGGHPARRLGGAGGAGDDPGQTAAGGNVKGCGRGTGHIGARHVRSARVGDSHCPVPGRRRHNGGAVRTTYAGRHCATAHKTR
jgi:hypothetical protein